eukprot:gene19933-25896_t
MSQYQRAGRVVFVRHGESVWNVTDKSRGLTSRFTGWANVDLTDKGRLQAQASGNCLKMFEYDKDVTIINSWRMNERHYGALMGLPKQTAGAMVGNENLTMWRRSWDKAPPKLNRDDVTEMSKMTWAKPTTIITKPGSQIAVAYEKNIKMPETESLKDCADRVLPLWLHGIAPRVARGETVLVVAHANSIRAILKYIEYDTITDMTVRDINIPSAIPLVYDFVRQIDSNDSTHSNSISLPNTDSPVRASSLIPIGEPTRLGIRGKYIASKELLQLHFDDNMNSAMSKDLDDSYHRADEKFYELVGKGLKDIIQYSDDGLGKKDALIITDGKGVILHSNLAWTALCGFHENEIVGRTNSFLQGPLTDQKDIVRLNEKLSSGLPAKGKAINYRKNGTAFENDFTIIPVYDWLNQSTDETMKAYDSQGASFAPHYFIARLNKTPDRFDLDPLTDEQIKNRNVNQLNDETVLTTNLSTSSGERMILNQ